VEHSFPGGLVLPDARTDNRKKTKPGPLGHMYPVYCVNCGADGGLVIAEFFFYLCEKCAETWGRLPLPEIPPDVARGEA
jgi:hypothetical protein